jgi:hypothetical protein
MHYICETSVVVHIQAVFAQVKVDNQCSPYMFVMIIEVAVGYYAGL